MDQISRWELIYKRFFFSDSTVLPTASDTLVLLRFSVFFVFSFFHYLFSLWHSAVYRSSWLLSFWAHYKYIKSLSYRSSGRTSSVERSCPVRVSIAALMTYSRVSVSVSIVMMPIEWYFSGVLVVVTWSTRMRPSLIAVSMATASLVLGLTYSPARRSMMPCDTACRRTNNQWIFIDRLIELRFNVPLSK